MLWLAVIVAGVLALVLLTRVSVRLRYDSRLQILLQIWWFRLDLLHLPTGKRKKKPSKDAGKKTESTPSSVSKPGIVQRTERVFALVRTFLEPTLAALEALQKRLRVDKLQLHIVVGCDDPAVTGMVYGSICAGMNSFLLFLEEHLHIRKRDVQVEPDFVHGESGALCDLIFSIRVWNLLVVALIFGYTWCREEWKGKKVAKPHPSKKHKGSRSLERTVRE
ncbi:MAG: DUF2953 domain-containing protein [Eubacteriales bacterium]|jgi:hypothetical protein